MPPPNYASDDYMINQRSGIVGLKTEHMLLPKIIIFTTKIQVVKDQNDLLDSNKQNVFFELKQVLRQMKYFKLPP